VVFRGTESTEDLWADLKSKQVEVRPQPRPGDPDPYQEIGARKVFIHAGFRDQFLAVSTALTRNVEVNSHCMKMSVLWRVFSFVSIECDASGTRKVLMHSGFRVSVGFDGTDQEWGGKATVPF
jgi:hypothetical protein